MRRTAIFLVLLFTLLSADAQVKIYKTYQDYLSNTSEVYGDELKFSFDSQVKGHAPFIKVVKAGQKVNLYCKEFWGFSYKNQLFRNLSNASLQVPLAVMDTGKICFYLIGDVVIDMLNSGKKELKGPSDYAEVVFFSDSLNTKIAWTINDMTGIFNKGDRVNVLRCLLNKSKDSLGWKQFLKKTYSKDDGSVKEGVTFVNFAINGGNFQAAGANYVPAPYFNKESVEILMDCMKEYCGK